MKRYLSAQDMERQASELSSFDGDENDFLGYVGAGDDFLEFSGPTGSFADPISKGKIFNLTITNGNVAARTALLCPGLIDTTTGLITDGAFNDINGAAGLSGAGSPGTVSMLMAFIKKFPSLIVGFKISCDNIAQFEQNVVIRKESPFKSHTSKPINVAIYASEQNPNTKLITVPEPFYMDGQTRIEYQVLPSTSVTIGLIFGTSLNVAGALRKKTDRAKRNIVAAGGQREVARSLYIGG